MNTLGDKTSLDGLKQALKVPGRGQTAADLLAELESPAYQARLERLQQLQNQIDLTMQEIYDQEKVEIPAIMWIWRMRRIIKAFLISSSVQGWDFLFL